MSDYKQTLQFLYDLQLFGIKVGLKKIQNLLDFLGHPERTFVSIHIAGTNGKGSTASMIAAILSASGYRTGLYTSPHLLHFSERIRVNGVKIPEKEIVRSTRRMEAMIRKTGATFFEATTAIAFQYFADNAVDCAVIETGLGGRLDATNVIAPALSVITNIGIEHTEHLGTTYSRIAFEKGGIIKPATPCITGTTHPDALRTLRRIARSKRAKLLHVDSLSSVRILERSVSDIRIKLQIEDLVYDNLAVSLAGDHQARNAQVAVVAAERLKHNSGFKKISRKSVRRGLQSIQKHAGLHGRFEIIGARPVIIADVAHNPDGMRTFISSAQRLLVSSWIVVFGVLQDKDYRAMMDTLAPRARMLICVKPQTDRALKTGGIVEHGQNSGLKCIDGGSVAGGIRMASREAREGEAILVVGSHYVVGEALNILQIEV